MRKILSSKQLQTVARQALTEIADVVGQTMGPGGNPIILQQFGQNPDGTSQDPLVTKDGVTVAEHVQFRDPGAGTIAKTILQVAKNTVNQAGDGTTTAIVLANALYQAGYQHMSQGANGIELYNDLKNVRDAVIRTLTDMRVTVKPEDLFDVAKISANGDEEVAKIVSDAILEVGEDGHVDLQDGFSRETTLEVVEGAMYKQGWRSFSPYLGQLMVTDKTRNVAELDNPAVLIYAGEFKSVADVETALKRILGVNADGGYDQNIAVMLIAYDYSDEAKNYIMQLKVQARMRIAAMKAPADGSPNARTAMLEDLAILLGGTVTARGIIDLDKIEDAHLGCAERVEIGAQETVFYGGQGEDAEILSRVSDLKTQLKTVQSEFDRQNLRLRIGKLIDGIAVIKAGGDTDLEMRERKDRIEDALCAAKVAASDGIIPGGGLALYLISQNIPGNTVGEQIMRQALQAPIRQIITNSGKNADVILSHMPKGKGYDARSHKYEDMMRAGIVDPLKVTRSALENAVSIAGLLLTSGGAIVSDADPKDGLANPLAGLLG